MLLGDLVNNQNDCCHFADVGSECGKWLNGPNTKPDVRLSASFKVKDLMSAEPGSCTQVSLTSDSNHLHLELRRGSLWSSDPTC